MMPVTLRQSVQFTPATITTRSHASVAGVPRWGAINQAAAPRFGSLLGLLGLVGATGLAAYWGILALSKKIVDGADQSTDNDWTGISRLEP